MRKRRKLVFHGKHSHSFRAVNEGCGKEGTYARDTVKKERIDGLVADQKWGGGMGYLQGKDASEVLKHGFWEANTYCSCI